MKIQGRKQKILIAAGVAGAIIVGLAVFWVVEYVQHQKWLLDDAQTLKPYRYLLWENGGEVPLVPVTPSENERRLLDQVAKVVLQHNQSQNILLNHLSMSQPRRKFFSRVTHVKVFIVTQVAGLPPGEERIRRVKAVYTLVPEDGGWRIVNSTDRTIE